jgi:hypothetical protein
MATSTDSSKAPSLPNFRSSDPPGKKKSAGAYRQANSQVMDVEGYLYRCSNSFIRLSLSALTAAPSLPVVVGGAFYCYRAFR